jgi:hypothetical protein
LASRPRLRASGSVAIHCARKARRWRRRARSPRAAAATSARRDRQRPWAESQRRETERVDPRSEQHVALVEARLLREQVRRGQQPEDDPARPEERAPRPLAAAQPERGERGDHERDRRERAPGGEPDLDHRFVDQRDRRREHRLHGVEERERRAGRVAEQRELDPAAPAAEDRRAQPEVARHQAPHRRVSHEPAATRSSHQLGEREDSGQHDRVLLGEQRRRGRGERERVRTCPAAQEAEHGEQLEQRRPERLAPRRDRIHA